MIKLMLEEWEAENLLAHLRHMDNICVSEEWRSNLIDLLDEKLYPLEEDDEK